MCVLLCPLPYTRPALLGGDGWRVYRQGVQLQSLSTWWKLQLPIMVVQISLYIIPGGVVVTFSLALLSGELLVPSQSLEMGDSKDWLSWKPRLSWAPRGISGNGSESDHCLQVREPWIKAAISLGLINGC